MKTKRIKDENKRKEVPVLSEKDKAILLRFVYKSDPVSREGKREILEMWIRVDNPTCPQCPPIKYNYKRIPLEATEVPLFK